MRSRFGSTGKTRVETTKVRDSLAGRLLLGAELILTDFNNNQEKISAIRLREFVIAIVEEENIFFY